MFVAVDMVAKILVKYNGDVKKNYLFFKQHYSL